MSLVIRCHAGRLWLRVLCDGCGEPIYDPTVGVAISAETRGGDEDRAGAAALGGAEVDVCQMVAAGVTGPVGMLVGWGPLDRPDPWAAVLAGLGVEVEHGWYAPWTADLLRRAVAQAGELHGRDPASFHTEAAAVVAESVARSVAAIARREAEEADLVAGMRAARAAAVAAAVVDDPRGERVARQEAHLSRELDRALAQLERLRGLRPPAAASDGADGPVGFGM